MCSVIIPSHLSPPHWWSKGEYEPEVSNCKQRQNCLLDKSLLCLPLVPSLQLVFQRTVFSWKHPPPPAFSHQVLLPCRFHQFALEWRLVDCPLVCADLSVWEDLDQKKYLIICLGLFFMWICFGYVQKLLWCPVLCRPNQTMLQNQALQFN